MTCDVVGEFRVYNDVKNTDMCNKKTKQNKNFPAKSESTYFPKDGSAMPQQILLLHLLKTTIQTWVNIWTYNKYNGHTPSTLEEHTQLCGMK